MAIFAGGSLNLEGLKYFDLLFCHNHFLSKPNMCAKFEQNPRFQLYHLLPGFFTNKKMNLMNLDLTYLVYCDRADKVSTNNTS